MPALKLDLSFASSELEQEFQEAQLLRSQRLEKQARAGARWGAGPVQYWRQLYSPRWAGLCRPSWVGPSRTASARTPLWQPRIGRLVMPASSHASVALRAWVRLVQLVRPGRLCGQ